MKAAMLLGMLMLCAPCMAQQSCRVTVTNTPSIETIGSISYLHVSVIIPRCSQVWRTSIYRSGTNISLTLFAKALPPWIICLDDPYFPENIVEEATIVLGALDPGSYTLALQTGNGTRVVGFPVFPSSPTLQLANVTTNTATLIIQGTSGASYIMERSSTLADWAPVSTNEYGQLSYTHSVSRGANAFFRVRVSDTLPVGLPCTF